MDNKKTRLSYKQLSYIVLEMKGFTDETGFMYWFNLYKEGSSYYIVKLYGKDKEGKVFPDITTLCAGSLKEVDMWLGGADKMLSLLQVKKVFV